MDLGALGVWIFISAIVIAGSLSSSRREAEKHETIRRILEKTGTIDEEKLKELFKTNTSWDSQPGSGYRTLRVLGTIVMFSGAAILVFFLVFAGLALLLGEMGPPKAPVGGIIAAFAAPVGIAVAGYGLFYASRFAEPPPGAGNDPPAR